ncbi:hypothetical protein CDV31_001577 [Fusarium ambrosium]|uniref:Uncharacterized protein n=1 Tax=Fusarium ambrosium TaxID=131363 RepID=A0A428UZJ9_9HYPO|nr:hypothetical protein CDV31_001577 [Fusarium ambrosium]
MASSTSSSWCHVSTASGQESLDTCSLLSDESPAQDIASSGGHDIDSHPDSDDSSSSSSNSMSWIPGSDGNDPDPVPRTLEWLCAAERPWEGLNLSIDRDLSFLADAARGEGNGAAVGMGGPQDPPGRDERASTSVTGLSLSS